MYMSLSGLLSAKKKKLQPEQTAQYVLYIYINAYVIWVPACPQEPFIKLYVAIHCTIQVRKMHSVGVIIIIIIT